MKTQSTHALNGLGWTFGDRLRKIRRREGISQSEFADALGINRKSVAAWESDINEPRAVLTVARKIEMVFGVPAAWTLGLSNANTPGPDGPGAESSYTTRDSNPEPAD